MKKIYPAEIEISELNDDNTTDVRVIGKTPDRDWWGSDVTQGRYDPNDHLKNLLARFNEQTIGRDELIELGTILSNIALPKPIRDSIKNSRENLNEETIFRISLKIRPPELRVLPFETLYIESEEGGHTLTNFLVLHPKISFARYEVLETKKNRDITHLEHIKMGSIFTSSSNLGNIDLNKEKSNLTALVDSANQDDNLPPIQFNVLDPTASSISYVNLSELDIFHFCGHGRFKEGDRSGGELLIRKDDTASDYNILPAQVLATNILEARLVSLSSCLTANRDPQWTWTGTTSALMREGIPAVLGMQASIDNKGSIAFYKEFYTALFQGLSIDEAVKSGRNRLLQMANETGKEMEWAIPVLHLRTPSSILFPKEKNIQPTNSLNEAARIDPFDKANGPIFCVAHDANRFFTGREAVLSDIDYLLKDEGRVVLSGLGGVGKSQIALEYAHRHRGDYRLIFWINADSTLSILNGYKQLATRLKLPEHTHSDLKEISIAVRGKLNTDPSWLLIFDNVDGDGEEEDLRFIEKVGTFLPPGGHVLITSRLRSWERIATTLDVDVLSPEESTDFLLQRTGQGEEADSLSEALGYLPLALEQAAAYVRKRKIDLGEYLNRFEEGRKTFNYKILGYEETIYTTWKLSMERINEETAMDVLKISALLAPDTLPRRLFDGFQSYDEEQVEEALVALDGYSLIELETDHYSMHRLLQYVLRMEIKGEEDKWHQTAVKLINDYYPGDGFEHWSELEVLLPHAQSLLDKKALNNDDEALLANRFGYYQYERGRYKEAEDLLHKALEGRMRLLNMDHRDSISSMNNMAGLFWATGHKKDAEPLYVQALESSKKVFGKTHPETLKSMNNLALLYDEEGRYEEAEQLFNQALEHQKVKLGKYHPHTLSTKSNLAVLYYHTRRYKEAEPILTEVFNINKRKFGIEDSRTIDSMNSLAELYRMTNRFSDAEQLLEESVNLSLKHLGEEHPSTLLSKHNLALLFDNLDRFSEAEQLYIQVLKIQSSLFGKEHPKTLIIMENLASVFKTTGRYQEAEDLYEKTIDLRKQILKEQHPDTLRSMNNLATLYQSTSRYQEALPLMQSAYDGYLELLGPQHPNTQTIASNLDNLRKQITSSL